MEMRDCDVVLEWRLARGSVCGARRGVRPRWEGQGGARRSSRLGDHRSPSPRQPGESFPLWLSHVRSFWPGRLVSGFTCNLVGGRAPIARLERPPLALTAALNPLPTHVLSDKHKTLILHGTVASSPLGPPPTASGSAACDLCDLCGFTPTVRRVRRGVVLIYIRYTNIRCIALYHCIAVSC